MIQDLPTTIPAALVPPPERRDAAWRAALYCALAAVGLYVIEVLINLARPRLDPTEAALTILQRTPELPTIDQSMSWVRLTFWAMPIGIAAAAFLYFRSTRSADHGELLRWAVPAALVAPFALIPFGTLVSHPIIALACVPSTGFALWLLHRSQRFARLPLPILLSSFGWGAFGAAGIAAACNILTIGSATAFRARSANLGVDPYALLDIQRDAQHLLGLHAGTVEELAKGVGVLVLLTLFGRRIGDVVSGVVLGAVAGLGFNFVESVEYMGAYNGAGAGFQYWVRQSITLLGAHAAFSALIGAGLGAATQLRQPRLRALAIGGGLLAGIGAHVASDTLPSWISHLTRDLVSVGGTADTLVITPLSILALQGPLIVLYILLLRHGLRIQAAALRGALSAEVATGRGAITEPEVAVLLNPALRLFVTITTWRRLGWRTALAVRRLQATQLELGRWHWQHGADDPALAGQLRARINRLRTSTWAGTSLAVAG